MRLLLALRTRRRPPTNSVLVAVAVLAIGVRLLLAAAFHGNYDEDSFEIVAGIMRRGGNVYAETSRYNYSPLWAHILLVLSYASDLTSVPFHFGVRAFGTAVDVADAVVVGLIGKRIGGWKPSTGFALYLINPITLLLTGYHGQFENLAVLPLLICLWLYLRSSGVPSKGWIWVLGTFALVVKHVMVFGVWTVFVYVFGWKRAIIASLAAGATVLLFFLPYLPAGRGGIMQNVLLYASVPHYFGLGLFTPGNLGMGIFLLAMAAWPMIAKRYLPLERALQGSSVALVGLIPGFGIQYLLIPVPFATPLASFEFMSYSFSAATFLLLNPANLNVGDPPAVVWLSCSVLTTIVTWAWLVSCVRNRPVHVRAPGLSS